MELTPPDPRIGQVLQGRYRILERVAAGAMGVVYRGERVELARPVAVKFLHPWIAAQQAFRTRFETEARAMSRLHHPNCASVIDFGFEGSPYVVMDFVTGSTLRQVLEVGPLAPARAVYIARQLLAGMAHAHAQGIIHRDLKPDNLILSDSAGLRDHVRILDFGLAKLRDGPAMTSGLAIGTPSYMSPEQTGAPGEIDGRTDIYAVGIVLHEMLAGRKPFVSDKIAEILLMHRDTPPPPLRQVIPGAGISPELEAVVLRALAKTPDGRFQTASAFVEALDRVPEAVAPRPSVDAGAPGPARMPALAGVAAPLADGDKTILDDPARSPLQVHAVLPAAAATPVAPNEPKGAGDAGRSPVTASMGGSSAGRKWLWLAGPAVLALGLISVGLRRHPNSAPAAPRAVAPAAVGPDPRANAVAGSAAAATAPAPTATAPDGAAVPPSAPPPSTTPPSAEARLAEADRLVSSGAWQQGLVVLDQARRENPESAQVAYQLANVALEHKRWADGAQAARVAAQRDPRFRSDDTLVKNLIGALASDKGYEKTEDVLHGFGAGAVPFLKDAAAHDKNSQVRARAAEMLRSRPGARRTNRPLFSSPSHKSSSHSLFSR